VYQHRLLSPIFWTPNARHELLPEAEAQRTLEAVSSMPLFGVYAGRDSPAPALSTDHGKAIDSNPACAGLDQTQVSASHNAWPWVTFAQPETESVRVGVCAACQWGYSLGRGAPANSMVPEGMAFYTPLSQPLPETL
jgi:hypothetical protein